MGRLEGKTALVTGAAQGIGKATVELFIKEGAKVVATDIQEDKLKELDGIEGVTTRVLNVMDAEAVEAAAEAVGSVDILFNCAGYVHQGTIEDCSEKDWDFSMNLNVKSLYYMNRAFLPRMVKAEKGGSIINMSSVASSIKGAPNRFVYGTSKAAVIGMTKSIAVDYVSHGIRCNAICPGTVETPSLHDRMKTTSKEEFVKRQKMGRLGTADEIAQLALYLGSDDSSYTTGTTHVIDGGWSI